MWTVYSTHMLGQVLVCFNWLWEQFLRLAADLWSRSPPTRQIFSENSNLSTGGSHALRFTAMPTVCFCPSLSHLVSYSHICVSVLFPVLCLQAVQHFVIAEVVCVCVRVGSSVSGPHLSVFTVPTFSWAGFIRELSPVKSLPYDSMCAHDGGRACRVCVSALWDVLYWRACVRRAEEPQNSPSLFISTL